MSERPQLVIFDCDGVLVDSEVIFHQVLSKDLTERGYNLSYKECMAAFMGGSMDFVADSAKAHGLELDDDWIDSIYAQVMTRLDEGVDLVDGIPELLDVLKQNNIPFCVASNGPTSKMDVTLGQNNLLPYFKGAIFSAYDIGIWKPDPGLFLAAATHFSISPKHCTVIEDSETGTLAAKAAGMPCLGYAPEGPSVKLTANGAHCFSNMSEVPSLLNLA